MRFTDQDAQQIVDAAARAPLDNLAAATKLADALNRFTAWFKLAAPMMAARDAQCIPDAAPEK